MLPVPQLIHRFIVFGGLILIVSSTAFAVDPANPNANSKARSILNFMASLTDKKDHRLISGQFLEFENNVTTDLLTNTYKETGKFPALAGADWTDWTKIKYNISNAALKWAWNQGCLVTVDVHMPNPISGEWGKTPTVDLKTLLKPGTDTYRRWFAELDTMANGLEDLRKAGVVVLFRPLHEMNGDWFWWGRKDQADYINVWRQIFDYYTNTKKLDNLLWVFAPNHGYMPASYYPGDNYCDLVGLDAYTSKITLDGIKGYPEMAALPKPFGFTEYGPDGAGGSSGNFDYRIFINNIKTYFPKTCFFLAWSGPWAIIKNKYATEALNDPYVANKDDIAKAFITVKTTVSMPMHTVFGEKSTATFLSGFRLNGNSLMPATSKCLLINHQGMVFDISGSRVQVLR